MDNCALNCNNQGALPLCTCKIRPQTTQDRGSLITAICISSKANAKIKQEPPPPSSYQILLLFTIPSYSAWSWTTANPCLALATFKKPHKQEV